MGLLSPSGGFTRYRIVEPVPDATLRDAPAKLAKFAFKDIDATADERSYGWVAFEDYLDDRWLSAPPEKGHYVAFSLRLDTRRVSPAVFKKHLRLALDAEKEAIKEAGKGFVSKDRKKELAEQVKLKLMARSLPIPAVFDAAWNTLTHTVWLASVNGKVQELFSDLFTMTFELHLEPKSPAFLAESLLGEGKAAALEKVEPSLFSAGR